MGVDKFISSTNSTPTPGHKGYPLQIKNVETNKVFECGTFDLKSVGELRAEYARHNSFTPPPSSPNACKFIIVAAEDPESWVFIFILFLIHVHF